MEQNETITGEAAQDGLGQNREPSAKLPKIWGFWATVGWGLGALTVLTVAQTVPALIYLFREIGLHPERSLGAIVAGILGNGPLIAIVTITWVPLVIAFLAWPIRLSRTPLRDYLALYLPDRRAVGVGLAGLVAVLVAESLSASIAGQGTPSFMTDTYASGRSAGTLPLLAVAFGLAAPIGEETLFRGFLYRGFARRLGAPVTIVITAALWAALHVQYDLFFMAQILVLGLYLGWVRWKSGSTLLTMFLHATVNSLALIGLAFGGGT